MLWSLRLARAAACVGVAAVLLMVAACSAAPAERPAVAPSALAVAVSSPGPLPASATPVVGDAGAGDTISRIAPPPTPTPKATTQAAAAMPALTEAPTATPPLLVNPRDEAMAAQAAALGAEFMAVSGADTGVRQFAPGQFGHPVALAVAGERLYLLDSGRVMSTDLHEPAALTMLLQPGDTVDGLRVLEPLDLAAQGDEVVVLDRAGDVYRYAPATGQWQLERNDRPIRESSGHYYIALALQAGRRVLLETSYGYLLHYDDAGQTIRQLPPMLPVDVAFTGDGTLLLAVDAETLQGSLRRLPSGEEPVAFAAEVALAEPVQVAVADDVVYVLDHGGRRLLLLDAATGRARRILQFPVDLAARSFALTGTGELIAAGRDRLYFVDRPDSVAAVAGADFASTHFDPQRFAGLGPYLSPIAGTGSPQRELQLPGAPRHYRQGVHAGIDFYWRPGTEVRAIADGTVLRIDLDYAQPTEYDFGLWHRQTAELGYTPEELLDHYRGRQVWIAHGDGAVARYGHLQDVAGALSVGATVTAGQALGTVGNSGSPESVESGTADAHLHFELWLGEHYLGRFLRPLETRLLINRLFHIR